jgi:hypothetical protein
MASHSSHPSSESFRTDRAAQGLIIGNYDPSLKALFTLHDHIRALDTIWHLAAAPAVS